MSQRACGVSFAEAPDVVNERLERLEQNLGIAKPSQRARIQVLEKHNHQLHLTVENLISEMAELKNRTERMECLLMCSDLSQFKKVDSLLKQLKKEALKEALKEPTDNQVVDTCASTWDGIKADQSRSLGRLDDETVDDDLILEECSSNATTLEEHDMVYPCNDTGSTTAGTTTASTSVDCSACPTPEVSDPPASDDENPQNYGSSGGQGLAAAAIEQYIASLGKHGKHEDAEAEDNQDVAATAREQYTASLGKQGKQEEAEENKRDQEACCNLHHQSSIAQMRLEDPEALAQPLDFKPWLLAFGVALVAVVISLWLFWMFLWEVGVLEDGDHHLTRTTLEDITAMENAFYDECVGLETALEPFAGAEARLELASKAWKLLQRCGVIVFPAKLFPDKWVTKARRLATKMANTSLHTNMQMWGDMIEGGRLHICPPIEPVFMEEMVRHAWEGPLGDLLWHTGAVFDYTSLQVTFPAGSKIDGYESVSNKGQNWHADDSVSGVLKVQCALKRVSSENGLIQLHPWGVKGRPLSLQSLRAGECLAYKAQVRHRGGSNGKGKINLDMSFRMPILGEDNSSVNFWGAAALDVNQKRRQLWESFRQPEKKARSIRVVEDNRTIAPIPRSAHDL